MNTNPDILKNEMRYEKSSSDYNITNRTKTNSTLIQPTWNASNQSRSPATEKSKMTI